jgi:hypothetical protein
MKKLFLFAAVAGLGLTSASPDYPHRAREARSGYPPCSRTVTDRCIQLYERGVRTPANLAQNSKPDDEATPARHASYRHACAARCARQQRVLAHRIRRAGERG